MRSTARSSIGKFSEPRQSRLGFHNAGDVSSTDITEPSEHGRPFSSCDRMPSTYFSKVFVNVPLPCPVPQTLFSAIDVGFL